MVIMLAIPVASAFDVSIENESNIPITTMQEFTHTVFVEYATLTTCPPCVTASNQLYSIYNSGNFDFYYVSLVSNEGNANVKGRVVELGVTGVPDVFFDGGYRRIKGGQSSELPYRNAITASGERDVSDIDINMDVTWQGNAKIKIDITVINNEAEEFKGRIRTYIVEKDSRWNDYSGKPYHYAAIDIPIDKDLSVVRTEAIPLGESYTISKTWRGGLIGFGDITKENIIVIASVFEKDTDEVVETAAAQPTVKSGNYRPLNVMLQRIFERFQILERIFNI
jgi:hypothetical protein